MARQRRRPGTTHPQVEREALARTGQRKPAKRRRGRYDPKTQPKGRDPLKQPGAKTRTHADELKDGGEVTVTADDRAGSVVKLNGVVVAVGPSLQSGATVVLGSDGFLAVRPAGADPRGVPLKINADHTVTL